MLHRTQQGSPAGNAAATRQSSNGASVSLRNVRKTYGPVVAIDDVSLDIGAGEFLAMLGPSGSGKSTILMSIAGFEHPQGGEILLGGQPILRLPPHRRGIGTVFQRYALFPHMTVAENVAYPLRRRGFSRADVESEVNRALELVNLGTYQSRYPAQLSGGQQQRVAVARALVFRPPLLLMDEPLGALDRKLRQQMQLELKLLHKELGTTIVMVTHDQEEALSMADRIALLNSGALQQVGTPAELYEAPRTAFVAGFIGETNLLPVEIAERRDATVLVKVECMPHPIALRADQCLAPGQWGLLAVRPEGLTVSSTGDGLAGRVIESAYGGSHTQMLIDVQQTRLSVRVLSGAALPPGSACVVYFDAEKCRIYPTA